MSRIASSALRPRRPQFNVGRETFMPVAKFMSLRRPPSPWLGSGTPSNIELGVRDNIVNASKKWHLHFRCEIVSVNSHKNKSDIVKTRTCITRLKRLMVIAHRETLHKRSAARNGAPWRGPARSGAARRGLARLSLVPLAHHVDSGIDPSSA